MANAPQTPLIAERIAHDSSLVSQGLLHPDCATTFYPADPNVPCHGVVLLLHGFTAGPWQFKEICHALQAEGLHSYAARLPGHGATASNTNATGTRAFSSHELPKSHQVHQFADCADTAIAAVQELGQTLNVPVMLVGFSLGGALAADLLLRSQHNIARAVLIAPMLRPIGITRRVFFRAIRQLPLGGRIIDRVPFAWRASPPKADGWVRPGHSNFHLGNISALFAYAHALGAQKKTWRVPSQFILTAIDDKIDPYACRKFAQKGPSGHAVWWFSAQENVPHGMLSKGENSDDASRRRVQDIVVSFLKDGVGHSNC